MVVDEEALLTFKLDREATQPLRSSVQRVKLDDEDVRYFVMGGRSIIDSRVTLCRVHTKPS